MFSHSRIKDAEHDAARVAYENLVTERTDDDQVYLLGPIDQVFSWHRPFLSIVYHIFHFMFKIFL